MAWSDETLPNAAARKRLFGLTRDPGLLVYANAFDHLYTAGRILGGDGAMPLFSHSTTSRDVCEAGVRFAWQFDAGISTDERVLRGAVALLESEEQRLRGAMRLPAKFSPRQQHRDRRATFATDQAITVAPVQGGCPCRDEHWHGDLVGRAQTPHQRLCGHRGLNLSSMLAIVVTPPQGHGFAPPGNSQMRSGEDREAQCARWESTRRAWSRRPCRAAGTTQH
jgi:hypothetical protein